MKKLLIRTSERTTFCNCRQQWHWSYVNRLRAKQTGNALRFGTLVHEALAAYYPPGIKRGPHPAKTFAAAYDREVEENGKFLIKVDDEKFYPRELGIAMCEGYVAEYGKDDRYKIVMPELPFQIDMEDPATGRYLCTYVGTWDALAFDRQAGQYCLLEHKTSGGLTIPTPWALDEQGATYFAFAEPWARSQGLLKPGQTVEKIVYNVLRKALPDDRPKNEQGHSLNKDGTVSKKQPVPLFNREVVFRGEADRQACFERIKGQVREMRLVRAGKLAVYKVPGEHCKWCPFRDMCEVHETGSDWEAMRDALYENHNPYAVHEERD